MMTDAVPPPPFVYIKPCPAAEFKRAIWKLRVGGTEEHILKIDCTQHSGMFPHPGVLNVLLHLPDRI